jgi:hypothetical protein
MKSLLRKFVAVSLATVLVFPLAVFAQDSNPSTAQANPTFRAETHQVLLDVVVTDHSGHFIAGLKPADFTILEDGLWTGTVEGLALSMYL